MLELKDLCFTAENEDGSEKQILTNVNLTIEDDKFIVVTGPNGSGKSTLAKLIMGIIRPTSGRIFFDGEDITDLDITDRAKKGISFAFQQPVRFKGIDVLDLMRIASGRDLSAADACKYLSSVGLCAKDYINREVNASLSGGEIKRIEIATVLARSTKLAIFDEPEAGIDLWSFQNLTKVFTNMRKAVNGSIIVISHQERILDIADEIILLSNHGIAKKGNKDDILPELLGTSAAVNMCTGNNDFELPKPASQAAPQSAPQPQPGETISLN